MASGKQLDANYSNDAGSGNGVLAAPAVPMIGNPPDMEGLMQQLAIQRLLPATQQLGETAAQVPTSNIPLPERGFGPTDFGIRGAGQQPGSMWAPMTGQGAGQDIKNIGGNILKGLLLGLSATGPGRAVEAGYYGPGVEKYEAQRGQRASEIEALKTKGGLLSEEARGASEGMSGIGGALYKQGMLAHYGRQDQLKAQHEQNYAQGIQNRLDVALQGLDLRKIQIGNTEELNKFKERWLAAQPGLAQSRIDAEYYGADTRAAVSQVIANVAAQNKMDTSHPFLQMLDQTLGTSLTPSAPQTPGGAQPVAGQTPLPARSGGSKANIPPKGTRVYDPQGGEYSADGTHPLPKGWSLTKSKARK